jgi:hypothetical protein
MKGDYVGNERKLEYNIIVDLSHIGRKCVDWIHLAQWKVKEIAVKEAQSDISAGSHTLT